MKMMKRFILLVGTSAAFYRWEHADTLTGIKRKHAAQIKQEHWTCILDTQITTKDALGSLHYAVIGRDGEQYGWKNADILKAIDCWPMAKDLTFSD